MSSRRWDFRPSTLLLLALLLVFFSAFLFYPVGHLLKGAFIAKGKFSLSYFGLLLSSPLQRQALANSFVIALCTTGLATLVSMPLAHVMTRFRFRGQTLLSGLLLVPLIMPPFVGAIGLRQLLARFGSVNLLLMKLGLIEPGHPIDWLGHG